MVPPSKFGDVSATVPGCRCFQATLLLTGKGEWVDKQSVPAHGRASRQGRRFLRLCVQPTLPDLATQAFRQHALDAKAHSLTLPPELAGNKKAAAIPPDERRRAALSALQKRCFLRGQSIQWLLRHPAPAGAGSLPAPGYQVRMPRR